MTTNQETKLLDILEQTLCDAERLADTVHGIPVDVAERKHDEIKTKCFKNILHILEG